MFLTITTTGTPDSPASDLGFLLHKHPARSQAFPTSHGLAHVFYPQSSEELCTAALLLEVDAIGLVRRGRGKGRGGSPDFALAQYVNDRPYAASSLLAVALRTVFATAMKGRCDQRPELAAQALPLRIAVPALPAKAGRDDGPGLVRRLFEPLGWQVAAEPIPLDERFPDWGDSRYVRLELTGTLRLADALGQLYVLLPVLDDAKHYWVAPDEVDKLLRAGEGWLADHPELPLITRRYLARRWSLARAAMEQLELARLAEADDREIEELSANPGPDPAADPDGPADLTDLTDLTGLDADPHPDPNADPNAEPAPDARPLSLAAQRRSAILQVLRDAGATRVADLGCGEGALVAALLKEPRFTEILGVDVSARSLAVAARRLRLDRMPERQARRVRLLQGALTYVDDRLTGYDAAVLSEVIEHVDPPRLPALEHAVFGAARPGTVVVTTPNAEYNIRWQSLPAGHVRHADHRFEWDRAQFRAWARQTAERYGYTVGFGPVGPDDPQVGPPTQLARFTRAPAANTAADHSTPPAGATP